MPRRSAIARSRPWLRLATTVRPRNESLPLLAFFGQVNLIWRFEVQVVARGAGATGRLTEACGAVVGRVSGGLTTGHEPFAVGELVPGASGSVGCAPRPQ